MAAKFLLNIQALKLLLNPICTMQAAAIPKTDQARHSQSLGYSYPKRMTARILHFHLIKSAVNVNPTSQKEVSSKNLTNSTSLSI